MDGEGDDPLAFGRWRAQVKSAMRGKRGQAFLRELAAEMDSMLEKHLIANELVNSDGDCCAIGVVCKARGIDVRKVDYEEPSEVGNIVGIAKQLVAEIEYENDECGPWGGNETPEERWERMRAWVGKQLVSSP